MNLFSFKTKTVVSEDEQHQIKRAVQEAEQYTSGEIKVIVEKRPLKTNIEERATALFEEHKLFNTELRNGVLIYVALHNKQFYILADEGIFKKLGASYWKDLSEKAATTIREAHSWVTGICKAIHLLGDYFKDNTLYPIAPDDINELSDDVTII